MTPIPATNETELRAAISQTATGTYGPVGPAVELPVGDVPMAATLNVSTRGHFALAGRGAFASRLIGGSDGKPVLRLEQCLRSKVEGLTVQAASGCRAGVELGNKTVSSGWPISSENEIIGVEVTGSPKYGVSVASWVPSDGDDTNDRDANNEFHQFVGVKVTGATTAGFHVRGGQAHRLRYSDCAVTGGKYGHWFEYGVHAIVERQQYTGVECCVKFLSFWTSFKLSHFRAEGCRRISEGTEGSPMPVVIEYGDADLTPNPDENVIFHVGSGPVVLRNLLIAATNGNPFRVGLYTHVPGTVRVEGLTLRWHNPANGDTPQKGVILGPLHQLAPGSDTTYTEEILWPNGTRSYRVVPIRPADDVARGRLPLPQLEGVYTPPVQWPPEPGTWKRLPNPTPPHHPLSKPRSWAVAFDWTPQALYGRGYNQHLNVLQANGVNLRLDWLSAGEYQLRAEGVGIQQNVGPLVVGQTYRLAFTWDRDENRTAMRIDGVTKAGGPGPAVRTQPEVGGGTTTDWSVGGPVVHANQYGGRQWATIANAVWYDRALSTTELAAC